MPLLAVDTISTPTLIVGVVASIIVVGLILLWYVRNPNQRP